MAATTRGALALVAACLLMFACQDPEEAPRTRAEVRNVGFPHDSHGEGARAVPAPYAGLTNPYADDPVALRVGREIYDGRCARCHGDDGSGEGPLWFSLQPEPAEFDEVPFEAIGDDYLFWRISEGGELAPFHSQMPDFKEQLSEQERWALVAYVRCLGERPD